MPRAYRMGRRADSVADTRSRIVEATVALHAERGVAATTMADIAGRAGVGVGTVYHHFPTYEDVIMACGARTMELTNPPRAEALGRGRSWPERVRILVAELFAYYDRHGGFWRAWCDRERFGILGELVARRQEHLEALVREVLAPLGLSEEAICTAVALSDFAVHDRLLEAGLSTERAATQVTMVLTTWLRAELRSGKRRGAQRPRARTSTAKT